MDHLDDLLAGVNALNDLLPDGLDLHLLDEVAGHLEVDIRFQQCHADIAQGVRNVGIGNFAETTQVAKGVLQLAAEGFKHKTLN